MFKLELLPRTLEACRRDLGHADAKVRLSVVRDLARVAGRGEREAAVGLLLAASGDANAEVRRQTLVALADLEAPEGRERALSLLCDVEITVRQMAVLYLGESAASGDDEVAGRLASLLRAGDASIRYQALIAHSQLRHEEAAGDLSHALCDADGEIRELAVRLVDEVMVARGLEVGADLEKILLQAAAHDELASVRLVAELLCAELGFDAPREMIRRVVGRRCPVREPRDEQRAITLAGKLDLKDAAEDLRRRAFGRLGFSLDPFRWTALSALCRWGDERAFDKVQAALRSKSPIDRAAALQSLADSGHPKALSLLKSLRDDPENLDREALTQALSTWEGESTAESV